MHTVGRFIRSRVAGKDRLNAKRHTTEIEQRGVESYHFSLLVPFRVAM